MQDTAAFEPNIRLGKGRVLAALGRLEEAQAELEGAAKTAADDYALAMRARLELADVYAAQDKPLEAGKSYMAVAILYDDPAVVPEALTRAVENFEKAGRTADAAKAYEELKERYPDHPLPQKPVPAAAGAAS